MARFGLNLASSLSEMRIHSIASLKVCNIRVFILKFTTKRINLKIMKKLYLDQCNSNCFYTGVYNSLVLNRFQVDFPIFTGLVSLWR